MTTRGWILFAAMAVIWGVPYLLIKIAVGEMPPASVVFGRTAIGALVLLPIAIARGSLRGLLPHWRALVVYTVVELGAPWFFLTDAERHVSSSLAGLLIAAVPLTSAVLVWVFAGDDRPDLSRVGGLLLGFVGVGLVVGFDVSGSELGAVAEIALVVIGYAVGPMIIARRLSDLPTIGVVVVSLVLTALAYAPFGVAAFTTPLSARAEIAVVALGLVCTALAFVLFFRLIAEVGPSRATVITYFNPAVAIVAGALFLQEPVTPAKVAGFALLAVGSYVGTRRRA
jgi:drug/metabolite transporter (DMT)-like permease